MYAIMTSQISRPDTTEMGTTNDDLKECTCKKFLVALLLSGAYCTVCLSKVMPARAEGGSQRHISHDQTHRIGRIACKRHHGRHYNHRHAVFETAFAAELAV